MRRKLFFSLQLILAAAVIGFAGRTVAGQWRDARHAGLGFHPRWGLIALSGLIVLAAYALLIETWRIMVRDWGSSLSWKDAARIWFVSNLGRYVPGKVWQIGAMGVMAQRAGVAPLTATGSALVINLVNLLAGVGVVAVTGASLLQDASLVVGAAVLLGAAVLSAPRTVPLVIRLYQRVTGKTVATPELPRRPIWIAAAACSAAWVLYGISFCVFARGVAPVATGEVASYVAAFTASYILGYVMLFAPGGLGVRDVTIAAFLEQLHLTTGGAGVLVAFASRLWLTVLEVLPGLVYLVAGARRGATATQVTPH